MPLITEGHYMISSLFLKIIFIFCSWICSCAILFFLNDFLLKVRNMNVNIVLDLLFLLNCCWYLSQELFHIFGILMAVRFVVFLIVYFSLWWLKKLQWVLLMLNFLFSFYQLSFFVFWWNWLSLKQNIFYRLQDYGIFFVVRTVFIVFS